MPHLAPFFLARKWETAEADGPACFNNCESDPVFNSLENYLHRNRCIYIYCGMHETFPPLACMCASFRRASRALTQHYEEALRPLGLRATQFTILQALSITGEVLQGKLGDILAMDTTTLTRTLDIMIDHKWVVKRQGKDRRERYLRLSNAGLAEFKRALPYWERVQQKLRKEIGNKRWDKLLNLTNRVTAASMTAPVAE